MSLQDILKHPSQWLYTKHLLPELDEGQRRVFYALIRSGDFIIEGVPRPLAGEAEPTLADHQAIPYRGWCDWDSSISNVEMKRAPDVVPDELLITDVYGDRGFVELRLSKAKFVEQMGSFLGIVLDEAGETETLAQNEVATAGGRPSKITPEIWAYITYMYCLNKEPNTAAALIKTIRETEALWGEDGPISARRAKDMIEPFFKEYKRLEKADPLKE